MRYTFGPKEYVPTRDFNVVSWLRINPLLKRGATMLELKSALRYGPKELRVIRDVLAPEQLRDHSKFARYLERRGYIQPV